MRSCTYLLTYTVGWKHIKPAISPKRLKIKRKLLLTAITGVGDGGGREGTCPLKFGGGDIFRAIIM